MSLFQEFSPSTSNLATSQGDTVGVSMVGGVEEEKAKKNKISFLKWVQFLLGQDYEKRELSEETGGSRKFIYNERGIPTGTREKEMERWRVMQEQEGALKCSVVN